MRNEDLRNKLNNIYQDFDREQLWSSIDLPKKERKRRGFFWLFFLGIAALSAISISVFNYQNNSPQLSILEEEHENIKSESTNTKLVGNNILSESESIPSLNSSQANVNAIGLEKVSDDKVDEPIEIHKNTRRQDLSNDYTNYSDSQVNIQKPKQTIEVNPSEKESSNNTIVNSENIDVISKIGNDETFKNSGKSDREAEQNVFLMPLPYIIKPLPKEKNYELRIDQNKFVENSTFYKYGISFFTLVGKSNHDFGNSLIRTVNETSLETLSLGVLGQIRIDNFELFSGFSFVKHNTFFNQDVQTISLLNGIKGPTRKTITTEYALYNSYQYLDVNLGFGYVFSLGRKWSIRPSFHGSYTISFDPNGDIVNQNDELVQLSDLDEYRNYSKWQGRVQFMLSREINKNWEVGIVTYISTSKTLADFEDLSHSVSSKGVGLSVSRFF